MTDVGLGAHPAMAAATWRPGMGPLAGVWIVPVPILAYYLCRALGCADGVSEDLVTLLVMVPLGGPHVVATFGRTLFDRGFWARQRWLAAAASAVIAVVLAAAISSAFFDVRLAGQPPMRYVLTFFFFWAGVHVLQQHLFAADGIAAGEGLVVPRRRRLLETALVLLSLYPVALFRMSMVGADGGADPDALATRIVLALGGSPGFADAYAFRIGRVAPLLPELLRHPALWIGVATAFVGGAIWFGAGLLRARRERPLHGRERLLLAAITVAFLVPLLPNLDTAFQGINAWHSHQYLLLAFGLQRAAAQRGELASPWLVDLVRRQAGARAYRLALGVTVGLVVAILLGAVVLEAASAGRFVCFGHDVPPRGADGAPLYRPGGVLLAYYLLGFGFLLVHYLQDTVTFLRGR